MITLNMSKEEAKALKSLIIYSKRMRMPLGSMIETCLVQIEKQTQQDTKLVWFENESSQFESLSHRKKD
jgi:hypothetical protein